MELQKSNSELIQKIFNKVALMEKKSESVERTSALFDVKLELIDIAINENLNLNVNPEA